MSSVAFNPIIMAPPNDFSTVYTTMKRIKEAASALGQSHTPIVFDMGLLTKALEISWNSKDDLEGVIPCEGGMHLLMSVFAAIGQLYGDAGLRLLLQDSGVYAAGTTDQILKGKDFDRALRAFKLVDEVLNARYLLNFKKWCEINNKTLPSTLSADLEELDLNLTTSKMHDVHLKVSENMEPLFVLLEEFRIEGEARSSNFRLWSDFLQHVMLPLKLYLAATRDGNWFMYHHSKIELLPLLFVTNRHTYARYLPPVLLSMNRLHLLCSKALLKDYL